MMYNLYSITSNQAAICALFRVVNRYVGNLATMPGVFPDYKALIVRTGADGRGIAAARLGMPSSVRTRMPQFWTPAIALTDFVADATLAADPTPEDVIRTIAAAVSAKSRAETMVGSASS